MVLMMVSMGTTGINPTGSGINSTAGLGGSVQ
jgi:hypothetical protein